MLLNQQYEIFLTEEQTEIVERWLQYCRQLYNFALFDKQLKYKRNKENYNRYDMQKQLTIDKKAYSFLGRFHHSLYKKFSYV